MTQRNPQTCIVGLQAVRQGRKVCGAGEAGGAEKGVQTMTTGDNRGRTTVGWDTMMKAAGDRKRERERERERAWSKQVLAYQTET